VCFRDQRKQGGQLPHLGLHPVGALHPHPERQLTPHGYAQTDIRETKVEKGLPEVDLGVPLDRRPLDA
jgi:hypothetical protein